MRIEYFELITRIEELDTNKGFVRALADIPRDSTVFQGHFPGHPIMPGVLLIEAMAQTSGQLILATNDYASMPFLVGVHKAKMRQFVVPGSRIIIDATMDHNGSGFAATRASVSHDGKRVAESEIRFATLPFPSDHMKALMLDLVERLGLPRPALA